MKRLKCPDDTTINMKLKEERKELLQRLFYRNDKDLYEIGRRANIPWFDRFSTKFERDRYAYFLEEEKLEAIQMIIDIYSNAKFVETLNEVFKLRDRSLIIDRFVGEHYYFDLVGGLKPENRQDEIRENVRKSIEETKGNGYYLLKPIIDLYRENRWDGAYGGAQWIDILEKARELDGPYPAPRYVMLLKSYRLYYKTGSRRYPTHTVPIEIIDVVDEVLAK